VLALILIVRSRRAQAPYAIGTLAAFRFFERLPGF
jgi:hypothetical protein